MIAVIIIVVVLLLLALLRFGLTAVYSADGVKIAANIGPFSILLYPQSGKKKIERRPKKRKKQKKKKDRPYEEQASVAEKGGGLKKYSDIMHTVSESLRRLRRRLLVNELTLSYTAAGKDPAKTAMAFGYANIAIGAVMSPLETAFRIRKRNVSAGVDFLSDEPSVYLRLKFSLAAWELVYIAAGLDIRKLKELIN